MRAKLIKEDLNFERGLNPKTLMGIGNEEVRNMNDSLKVIQDLFKNGFDDDNMSFSKTIDHVDLLRNVVDYTLKNHIKKKYGWDLIREYTKDVVLTEHFL